MTTRTITLPTEQWDLLIHYLDAAIEDKQTWLNEWPNQADDPEAEQAEINAAQRALDALIGAVSSTKADPYLAAIDKARAILNQPC